MQDSFGMMEGAYFVSRIDLLGWMNDVLQINLTKIEQLGTGAVYCQILDVCFPGKVPLNRVNWRAKHEYEFLGNLKILQLSFNQLGIKKQIEVEKLAKARYQDNLEFAQWMKRFYELKFGQDSKKDYNPNVRRGFVKPDFPIPKQRGASSKPSLVLQNNRNIFSNKKEERPVEKKIKLSQGVSKSVKNNSVDRVDNSLSFLKEREDLTQKLEFIQQLIISSKENDQYLLKKVRDFIGMAYQGQGQDESLLSLQRQDTESLLQGEDESDILRMNFSQNDLSFVIEGESL